jgi:hypothetical protein
VGPFQHPPALAKTRDFYVDNDAGARFWVSWEERTILLARLRTLPAGLSARLDQMASYDANVVTNIFKLTPFNETTASKLLELYETCGTALDWQERLRKDLPSYQSDSARISPRSSHGLRTARISYRKDFSSSHQS